MKKTPKINLKLPIVGNGTIFGKNRCHIRVQRPQKHKNPLKNSMDLSKIKFIYEKRLQVWSIYENHKNSRHFRLKRTKKIFFTVSIFFLGPID